MVNLEGIKRYLRSSVQRNERRHRRGKCKKNIKGSHYTKHDDGRRTGRTGEKGTRRSERNTGKIREIIMRLTRKTRMGRHTAFPAPSRLQDPGRPPDGLSDLIRCNQSTDREDGGC